MKHSHVNHHARNVARNDDGAENKRTNQRRRKHQLIKSRVLHGGVTPDLIPQVAPAWSLSCLERVIEALINEVDRRAADPDLEMETLEDSDSDDAYSAFSVEYRHLRCNSIRFASPRKHGRVTGNRRSQSSM